MIARSGPKEPARENNLKELQGTWTLLAYSVDGKSIRGEDMQSALTIEDNRWTITWRKDDGGQQVEQGTVRVIDATGRPRVMDLVQRSQRATHPVQRVLYAVPARLEVQLPARH